MAVESPASGRVRADQVSHSLGRLDDESVFVGSELTVAIFQLAPKSMQMNGVLHHGVIDQHEADTFTEFQMNRLGLRKLTRIEAPDEPLHTAGEVKNNFASRLPAIHASVERPEVGVGQHATAVSIEAVSRIVQ